MGHGNRKHLYNGPYSGSSLDHIAFPMGGIGAGMICLEGTGALSHVSLRHRPEVYHEPMVFSALWVKGTPTARILEGPVPKRKTFGPPGTGNGNSGKSYGLPRFREVSFVARFPFGSVKLSDPDMPVSVELTGWSPFIPGDADSSSLPVCALEFDFSNATDEPVEAVYSFHARNFMRVGGDSGAYVEAMEDGFILCQPALQDSPVQEGSFSAVVPENDVGVDCAWFRGGWFDSLTMLWRSVCEGRYPSRPPHADGSASDGASLYRPFRIEPRENRKVRLLLA